MNIYILVSQTCLFWQGGTATLCSLLSARDDETLEAAARALHNLALDADALPQLRSARGMPALVRLLKSPNEHVREAASAALEVVSMETHGRDDLLRMMSGADSA
jgi:HEAT repeat protein|tara:strand:+ start:109 stop:423 length:315 start_codon:yes stop_codon:yes gene_type:complete